VNLGKGPEIISGGGETFKVALEEGNLIRVEGGEEKVPLVGGGRFWGEKLFQKKVNSNMEKK